jgi:hypothetical protein
MQTQVEDTKHIGCVPCLIFCLFVAYTVWASLILDQSHDQIHACAALWPYCLVFLCVSWISSCITKRTKTKWIHYTLTFVGVGILIWGIVIMSHLLHQDACRTWYAQESPNLLLLFDVTFWILVALYALACVILSVFVCTSGQ